MRYLAYHPDAERLLALGDFSFYAIAPLTLRYIGGFGEIHWIPAAEQSGLSRTRDTILLAPDASSHRAQDASFRGTGSPWYWRGDDGLLNFAIRMASRPHGGVGALREGNSGLDRPNGHLR